MSRARQGEDDSPEHRPGVWTVDTALWATLVVSVLAPVAWLGAESLQSGNCHDTRGILAIAHWFDPVFFQYNLVLAAMAILVTPTVPFLYCRSMAGKKKARLIRELPSTESAAATARVDRRTRFRFYYGGALLTTLIVTLGVSILLFFKPLRDVSSQCGVDFSKGANMLVMGPFIGSYGDAQSDGFETFYRHLIFGQTGFQFGFLGAYIYFLGTLARAYFALDLTPETLIDGSVRIGTASIVSLVLSFLMVSWLPNWLPVVCFFFGFFPRRAFAFLEQFVSKATRTRAAPYQMIPLTHLYGMSYSHELRLNREGFDTAENFSFSDPVDLAVRTGFSFGQLRQWKSEAWLAVHLRESYAGFVERTGITSRDELEGFFRTAPDDDKAQLLLLGDDKDAKLRALRFKLAVIRTLLKAEDEGRRQ
jgi:hypothetical protein